MNENLTIPLPPVRRMGRRLPSAIATKLKACLCTVSVSCTRCLVHQNLTTSYSRVGMVSHSRPPSPKTLHTRPISARFGAGVQQRKTVHNVYWYNVYLSG